MEPQVKASSILVASKAAALPACPDEIDIFNYDHQVPDFAGPAIEMLYKHLYCSLSFYERSKESVGASTYVAREDGRPVTVLLYKQSGSEVSVINDFAKLKDHEIQRFAHYIFNRLASVNRISFRKVNTKIDRLTFPWHAMTSDEDMIIALPPTAKKYETAVGKNMRRNIKRYANALIKDFPSFQYRVYLDQEIREQDVLDIIRLSCLRMKSKNIAPRFGNEEIDWIIAHAKRSGIVGVATIDGHVCGGAIGFHMADNYFMHVIAHDPKYNGYSLGILCYFYTICEGIACGAKRFHLLQGRYAYKYRLLAQRQDVFQLDIYRNRFHYLASAKSLLIKEIKGRIRLASQWLLHDAERHDTVICRIAAKAVSAARKARRSKGSLPEMEQTS